MEDVCHSILVHDESAMYNKVCIVEEEAKYAYICMKSTHAKKKVNYMQITLEIISSKVLCQTLLKPCKCFVKNTLKVWA